MSNSKSNLTPEHHYKIIERRRSEGFTVIESDSTSLLLDLDDVDALRRLSRMLPLAEELFGAEIIGRWQSRNGNHHVVLRLRERMSLPERLMLQACLGSDPKREMLALKTYLNGVPEPSLLFKPPSA